MKNKLKVRTPILALLLFVFTVGQTFAADKVVVLPLAGSDITEQQFNEQHVWAGTVNSNGTKYAPGLYTSSRISEGQYRVVLNMDGFEIPNLGSAPNVVHSPKFGDAGTKTSLTSTLTVNIGGNITGFQASFETHDALNALADSTFSFMIKFPEPNPPAPTSAASLSDAIPEGAVCETVGGETTCTVD